MNKRTRIYQWIISRVPRRAQLWISFSCMAWYSVYKPEAGEYMMNCAIRGLIQNQVHSGRYHESFTS